MRTFGFVAVASILAAVRSRAEPLKLSVSQKMASDLIESRTCETVPEDDYTRCHYTYEGLRFTRVSLGKLKPRPSIFVSIDSLEPGPVTVQVLGRGACVFIAKGADDAESVGSVAFRIQDGTFHINDVKVACHLP